MLTTFTEIEREKNYQRNLEAAKFNAAKIAAGPTVNPNFFPAGAFAPDPQQEASNYLIQGVPTQRQRVSAIPGGINILKSLTESQFVGPQEPAYDQYIRTGSLPKPQQYVSQVNKDLVSPYYGIDEKLMNDSNFRNLRERDPAGASKIYKELTGVDYSTAIKSLAATVQNREQYADAIMKDLQGNLVRDENDNLATRVVRLDQFGNKQIATVPLSPEQQEFINSGEFVRRSGAKVPQGIATLQNVPTDNREEYVKRYREHLQKSGGNQEYAHRAALKELGGQPDKKMGLLDQARLGIERKGILGTIGENMGNFAAETAATVQHLGRGLLRDPMSGQHLLPRRTADDFRNLVELPRMPQFESPKWERPWWFPEMPIP